MTRAFPIDAHPDPVVVYEAGDDGGRVTGSNPAAAAAFDGLATGTPLSGVLERFDVVRSTADATTGITGHEPVVLSLEGEPGRFVARATVDDGTGYLVFTAVGDELDAPADVGQVTSVISHDLRNPLDVATAHLRAARETGDPEHFDAVATAHERMEQIIRDVLTLTRGGAEVDREADVAVGAAARDAWDAVDTANATLRTPDALPTLAADPERLRRLFENLFRNAVDHAGPDVTVTVAAVDGGFAVADDGPGIPADDREAVLEAGHSTDAEGTGLGLAIVATIVDAHGWTLDVTDADGGGARFEVHAGTDRP